MRRLIPSTAMSVTFAWLVWAPLLAGCGPAQVPTHVPSKPEVACDGSDAPGCTKLGIQFAEGRGVRKDEARAAALLTKTCDEGSAGDCCDLSYLTFVPDYFLNRKYEKRIAARLAAACDWGGAVGCSNLGALFAEGRGVNKSVLWAESLFTRACDEGYAVGCFNLGVLLEANRKYEARAVEAYGRGCALGYEPSCAKARK